MLVEDRPKKKTTKHNDDTDYATYANERNGNTRLTSWPKIGLFVRGSRAAAKFQDCLLRRRAVTQGIRYLDDHFIYGEGSQPQHVAKKTPFSLIRPACEVLKFRDDLNAQEVQALAQLPVVQ